MLLIRLKTRQNTEKRKLFLFSNKLAQDVTIKENNYNLDPSCIFRTKLFPTLGLFGCNTIDYIEGNPNPIKYTEMGAEQSNKMKPALVAKIIKEIVQGIPKIIFYATLLLTFANTALLCILLNGGIE